MPIQQQVSTSSTNKHCVHRGPNFYFHDSELTSWGQFLKS